MSMHDDIKTVLVREEQLKAKVAELGAQISRDYAGKNLVLVSILKGSVVFMADLMRAVSIPCSIDFMVVSSYGGGNTTSTGLVKIIKDLDGDLSGKDVLIVEDILDTGITLSNLVPMLKMRNPNSVKICTILDKPSRRKMTSPGLRGLRGAGRVRGGLRPRLRREVPQPALHRRTQTQRLRKVRNKTRTGVDPFAT